MATVKPRITITLKEHQYKLLSVLADLQGGSMSSIMVDLLESVEPVLERLAVVLQAAKDGPQSVRLEIKKSAEDAERVFLPLANEMMGQLDLLVGQVGGGAEVSALAGAGVPSTTVSRRDSTRPPASNRGVRITTTPTITAVSSFQDLAKKGNNLAKKGKKEAKK